MTDALGKMNIYALWKLSHVLILQDVILYYIIYIVQMELNQINFNVIIYLPQISIVFFQHILIYF